MKKKKGFALLYAILLTGAVLSVGVILMNIITKQLIFSSVSRQSEISYYYLANSGRECLRHYLVDLGDRNNSFYRLKCPDGVCDLTFFSGAEIKCLGGDVLLTKGGDPTKPTFSGKLNLDSNQVVDFIVQINANCLNPNADCSGGENLIDNANAVMRASGYSGSNRGARRSALTVWR